MAQVVLKDWYTQAVADTRFLKLDTSNGPLTGNLTISKPSPILHLKNDFGAGSLDGYIEWDDSGDVAQWMIGNDWVGGGLNNFVF